MWTAELSTSSLYLGSRLSGPIIPSLHWRTQALRIVMTDDAEAHINGLIVALSTLDRRQLSRWGQQLASVLSAGGRLLVAGNGGSAAEAQHLTAELVGRFRCDRQGLSAVALHADTSSLTAVGNDFGFDQIFARQVEAHGRPSDVLLVLSTSGLSPNLMAAVSRARKLGLVTWALTGPTPNPLATACDDHVAAKGDSANVQECHLVAVHLMSMAVEEALTAPNTQEREAAAPATDPRPRKAEQLKVVIIGDLLLDETLSGAVERVSPEAPVPVVQSIGRTLRPGGAGLAATLAADEGGNVTLITAYGQDDSSRIAAQLVTEAGVKVINLGTGSPTPVKTRVRAAHQTLLMLDRAEPASTVGPLPLAGRTALESAAAILVADYGRGVAASEDVRSVLTALSPQIPVIWDPHPRGPVPVPGTAIASPNRREAAHFVKDAAENDLRSDIARARHLVKLWKIGHLVVTRDQGGAVMVTRDDAAAPLVVPAPLISSGDACGAGDRLAVALTMALASGVLPSAALPQAVAAASAFVARTRGQRKRHTDLEGTKLDPELLATTMRKQGGTVVATGGCFDLLHRGHVAMLEQARLLGDCLIVCINGDASVARLKGRPRPLVPVADRVAVLEALACVDGVLIFDEDTPVHALDQLQPHIYVKGGDYAIEDLPERAVVERGGGQVLLLPYLDGRSTTSLLQRASLGPDVGGSV
jgi:D-beta-D-heptose 7-phosphate kinase/D-beta-D-heptose 1-phosphate adenosyltransferase